MSYRDDPYAGSQGGSMPDPYTLLGAKAGLDFLGGLMGGKKDDRDTGAHLASPKQRSLLDMLLMETMGGAGDFGFNQAWKRGQSSLSNALAGMGVGRGSGVHQSLLAQTMSDALGADAQNRRSAAMGLVGLTPGVLPYNNLWGVEFSSPDWRPGMPQPTGQDNQAWTARYGYNSQFPGMLGQAQAGAQASPLAAALAARGRGRLPQGRRGWVL